MKITTFTIASAIALSTAPLLADGHANNMGYAIANGGTTLAVMAEFSKPTEIKTYELTDAIKAIAYRPVTGDLLAYSGDKLYTLDPMTGTLTDLKATFMDGTNIAADAAIGFDFNNKIDAVRIVSSAGDNLVYFPDGFGDNDERASSVRRFTELEYAEGDASFGKEPAIYANAYTNAIAGAKASGTFQYAIDARANALVSLANNAGTLETIGLITVDGKPADVLPAGGFDIVSPAEGTDEAYAILQIDGQDTAGVYAIDLTSGAATLISDLGMGGFSSFALSMK